MCLTLQIHLTQQDTSLGCGGCPSPLPGLDVISATRWGFSENTHLLSAGESYCACSLLTENQNWNSLVWTLKPELLSGIAFLLKEMLWSCIEGFAFEALWLGIPSEQEIRLTLPELAHLVLANDIRKGTRYLVAGMGELGWAEDLALKQSACHPELSYDMIFVQTP